MEGATAGGGGQYMYGPFGTGIQAGLLRVAQAGFEVAPADLEDTLAATGELLAERGLSDRFVTLFAELVTVAGSARANYHEPALTRDQLASALEQSVEFFNSFTCWD